MKFKPTLLAALLAPFSLAVIPLVQAEQAKPEDDKVERIAVIGSNLKRSNEEGTSLVEVFNREQIAQTGAATIADALNAVLPKAQLEFGTDGGRFAPGANTVSLRGLGTQNTLILLNGRRYAPNAFANLSTSIVSLNTIPLSAIEQIEVLYDGAAAIYGSDAVAGVINFRTKQNYTGTALTAQYGGWQAGDGERLNIGLAKGFGSLDSDGYNLLLTLDGLTRQPTYWKNHAAARDLDRRPLGGSDNRFTGLTAGEYRLDGGLRRVATECPGQLETLSGGDYCFSDQNHYQDSETKRVNANALLRYRLSDSIEFFAEAGVGKDDLAFNSWPLPIPAAVAVVKPTDAVYRTELGGLSTEGKDILLTRRLFEAGLGDNWVESDSFRSVLGLDVTLGDWDLSASLLHHKNRSKQNRPRVNSSRVTAAFADGSFDPFVSTNSVAATKALLDDYISDGQAAISVFDLKAANNDLYTLAGGQLGLSVGLALQHDQAREARNFGSPTTDSSRTISSVYAELSVPLAERLETQLAVRYDRYNDVGGATSPKIALAYQFTPELLLRTSANTTFRAPSLQQLNMAPTGSYWFYNDWARCTPMGKNIGQCTGRVDMNNVSNPELRPETSINQTIGAVWSPSQQFTLSADWYLIRQKDTISRLNIQYILDNEDTDPALAALIKRNPLDQSEADRYPGLTKGSIDEVDAPLANIGRVETSGIELALNYQHSLNKWGRLSFNNKLSYLLSYKRSDQEGLPLQDRTGGTNYTDWVNKASLTYHYANWHSSVVANTYDRTRDISDISQIATNPDGFVPSYTVFDITAGYRFSQDLSARVGVRNAFDKLSPYSKSAGGYIGVSRGRYIFIGIDYQF